MTSRIATLVLAGACAGAVLGAGATPVFAEAAAASASTAAATVGSIYRAEKARDPFMPASSGGENAGKVFTREDFNIHNLSLRGIMRDRGADYALFKDEGFGVSFILRQGKLYDGKNKAMAGISGSLNVKRKTAHLMTREGDVQTFRLGEESSE